MSKKLIDVTNKISAAMFHCEKVVEGVDVKAEIDLALQSIIDSGISMAIPRALYLKMQKDPKEEVTIQVGPFIYGISLKKMGDTMSFNPIFSLANEKKTINELSEFEDSISKNHSIIKGIVDAIEDDGIFLDTIIHSCKLDIFNVTKDEWEEQKDDADKGAELDKHTAAIFTAIHIAAILHVLASTKNPDELVKYEIPGEGTYTIQKVKNKWEIGFIAGKEFKQTIKNDRLLESLADE